MSTLDPLQLRFSHEELVVLLELQELPMIAGIGQNPFGYLTENIQTLLKQAALRSLLARNIVKINADGKSTVDEHLSKILFFCAHPLKLITIIWQEDGTIHTEYVYQVPELSIVHAQVYPGVHELVLFESDNTPFTANLLERLNCSADTLPAEQFTLSRRDFNHLHAMAEASTESELKELLISLSIEEQIATRYTTSLISGGIKFLVEAVSTEGQDQTKQELTILATPQGCWLIEGMGDPEKELITIKTVDANKIGSRLKEIFRVGGITP